MLTTIIILSAALFIVLLWALSMKDPCFPVNPYPDPISHYDFDCNSFKFRKLEMENLQLRSELNKYGYYPSMGQDISSYEKGYEDGLKVELRLCDLRFGSISERKQIAKKLSETIMPLEELRDRLNK